MECRHGDILHIGKNRTIPVFPVIVVVGMLQESVPGWRLTAKVLVIYPGHWTEAEKILVVVALGRYLPCSKLRFHTHRAVEAVFQTERPVMVPVITGEHFAPSPFRSD